MRKLMIQRWIVLTFHCLAKQTKKKRKQSGDYEVLLGCQILSQMCVYEDTQINA